MIVLLAAVFHHTALGLQVVVEDYVHSGLKFAAMVAVRLACYGLCWCNRGSEDRAGGILGCSADQSSVERDLDGGARLRNRTAVLRRLGAPGERLRVDPRDVRLSRQVDPGDGEAVAARFDVDRGGCGDPPRGKAGLSEHERESAIEKQAACAAPRSSSGFVPAPSSNRDRKE